NCETPQSAGSSQSARADAASFKLDCPSRLIRFLGPSRIPGLGLLERHRLVGAKAAPVHPVLFRIAAECAPIFDVGGYEAAQENVLTAKCRNLTRRPRITRRHRGILAPARGASGDRLPFAAA